MQSLALHRHVPSVCLSLVLCAAGLSCKGPVVGQTTGAVVAGPDVRTGAGVECQQSRSALRGSVPPSRGEDREPRPVSSAPEVRPFHRCFGEDTALTPARSLTALLDRAADLYEQATRALPPDARSEHKSPEARGEPSKPNDGKPEARGRAALPPRARELLEGALTCSAEASRVEPRSVESHHGRAIALQELGRLDEARDAFTRALAIDPDDPETLAAAADLYINRLPPGASGVDHTETGLEYARRGTRRARRSHDKGLVARLALLEGQALNDLGHAREALARLDASLSAVEEVQARYERAVALFDLCRFEDARRGFEETAQRSPEDAWAHHHLGLVLEFLGRQAEAEQAFARARRLQPHEFREVQPVSVEEFRQIVDKELRALPPDQQADLRAVQVETADLPDLTDLTAEEPPLSPTILGLFRGSPLPGPGEGPAEGPRTIVLYRKNLLRATTSREELLAQVRTTLLHELGHLHGEDDEVLRARGLE